MEQADTIKINRQQIMATEMYQGLSPILQSMTLRRGSVLKIENGVNVAMNIGYEKWEKQSDFLYRNRMIVKEIVEELKVKNSEV